MRILLPDGAVEVFTITPRTLDPARYRRNIEDVVRWSDRHGATGVLLFTGNDTYVDPWLVAQTVCATTERLCPLVAVNPVYMHPFTAAKMISSLAYLYGRRVWLNLVVGTALSHGEALNDHLTHDERYERLTEYGRIVRALLAGRGLTSVAGRYYAVANLQLFPRVQPELAPEFLLAGQSDAARRTADALGAVHMRMLAPELDDASGGAGAGIHFGIVTRPLEDDAWAVARMRFPGDPIGREMLERSMANTDAEWKRRLKIAAEAGATARPGYWLEPFRSFKADCPYFVGSHAQTATLIARLVARGVRVFILDVPADEEDLANVAEAFRIAALLVRRAA